MKRLSIVGLMLASAFALTNCSQEIVPPIQENDVIVDESIKEDTTPEEVVSIPFEVYANPSAETRTAHDSEKNGTKWSANDTINVYHSVHNRNSYTNNHAFIIADVEKGLFGGGLAEPLASGTYDWCFLYPYDKSRGNTTTTTVQIGATKGTDGAYVQRLTNGAGSKEHIAGTLFPMYGHASGISAYQNPKVQMRHMSAIVALKIVNQGDSKKENLANEKNETDKSSITINDITFAVPEYNSSAIKQTKIPIVGSFKVDPTSTVNSNSFTPVDDASSNSVSLDFTSTTIKPGESATFYVAVRPFDVSNSTLGGTEGRTGLTLSITVNGSTRSVEIPAETKFEAGKVTTLRVPVKLSYPKASDAVEGTSFITWSSMSSDIVTVNGESVNAYIVGSDNLSGSLTLTATAAEMIKALDVGFYASTWKDKRAAMTVSKINVWFPDGNKLYKISEYEPLEAVIKNELKDDMTGLSAALIYLGVPIVMGTMSSGVPRDEGTLTFIYLTKFIDPQSITFNGVLENGAANVNDDIFFLDENPIYKEIKAETVDRLLSEKFIYNNQVPTYAGLLDIVNGNNTPEANLTAEVLYNKLRETVAGRGEIKMTLDIKLKKYNVDINLGNVFDALISNPDDLKAKLPKMKFAITISTCPYHADKAAGYGSKASPIALDDIEGPKNPIILWGLDAYGPNASAPQL